MRKENILFYGNENINNPMEMRFCFDNTWTGEIVVKTTKDG